MGMGYREGDRFSVGGAGGVGECRFRRRGSWWWRGEWGFGVCGGGGDYVVVGVYEWIRFQVWLGGIEGRRRLWN